MHAHENEGEKGDRDASTKRETTRGGRGQRRGKGDREGVEKM